MVRGNSWRNVQRGGSVDGRNIRTETQGDKKFDNGHSRQGSGRGQMTDDKGTGLLIHAGAEKGVSFFRVGGGLYEGERAARGRGRTVTYQDQDGHANRVAPYSQG